MAFLWPCMAINGRCMGFYGLIWQNIDLEGLLSSYLVVIDPNSCGLVMSRKIFNLQQLSFDWWIFKIVFFIKRYSFDMQTLTSIEIL